MIKSVFRRNTPTLAMAIAAVALTASIACGTTQTPAASLVTAGFGGAGAAPFQQMEAMPFDVVQVSGVGRASAAPDLATVNLAVAVTADTVAEARQTAAVVMTAVQNSLTANEIADADFQTTHFNVGPRYDYGDDGRELVGYEVRQGLVVTVRAIDTVGDVIDDAITAGGDDIQFNGLSFSIEDTSDLQREAREAAVDNMHDRASQLAEFAGRELGDLKFVGESPVGEVFAGVERLGFAPAAAADFASTPISAGESEVVISINGVYALKPTGDEDSEESNGSQ